VSAGFWAGVVVGKQSQKFFEVRELREAAKAAKPETIERDICATNATSPWGIWTVRTSLRVILNLASVSG
jgi:hypothetical protein